ncbi:MAG TPA: hypothetical protein VMZ30_14570 [Pyrinomonadaceae bacterium]|nr:hypothetical protein [Pyrinomonadaceae bacterium]
MKLLRVTLLTGLLLVGATTRDVSIQSKHGATVTTPARQTSGECYLVNGIWICQP